MRRGPATENAKRPRNRSCSRNIHGALSPHTIPCQQDLLRTLQSMPLLIRFLPLDLEVPFTKFPEDIHVLKSSALNHPNTRPNPTAIYVFGSNLTQQQLGGGGGEGKGKDKIYSSKAPSRLYRTNSLPRQPTPPPVQRQSKKLGT